ncbi:MAG: flagellar hook-associated protein FlgK [Gammaproteobacteria bacterium]
MADILNIGVSALLSTQRALSTIGHNISNANTPGYSRQRVELAARAPQVSGNVYFGKGVGISDVSRAADAFLNRQVQLSSTSYQQASSFYDLATQLNNMLADSNSGLSTAMTGLFSSIEQLANQPTSIPSRQALLGSAGTLVSRMHDQIARLDDINSAINTKLADQVRQVNELAASIADLNKSIVLANGRTGSDSANDLLDRRDQLVLELSEITGVSTFIQDDGAMNVMVGDGLMLVTGSTTAALTTQPNSLDASRLEVGYLVGGVTSVVSSQMSSGQMGGTLAFREDLLEPTRNALGRLSAALAMTFNAQHQEGVDMNGAMGGDFFSIPSPSFNAASGNTGTITLAFDSANVGDLTISDYDFTFDGTDWQLYRYSDGTTQTLSGAGPFSVDGLTITVGTAPAAGDTYRLQPTRYIARDIGVAITDAREVAAASPVRAGASLSNLGNVNVTAPEILDASDANLTTTVTLVFDDPPTSYRVNGAGASIAYTAGANIDINGWRIQLSGTPAAGDQVVIEANTGGVGDNRNLLALAELAQIGMLEGGTATYGDAYGAMVGNVGTVTRQHEVSSTALKTLLENAVSSQQALSGVNLDEEAANLLKFQQAYQAAAQVIATGNTVFDELLNAVRG